MDRRLRLLERHRHDSVDDETAYLQHLLRAGSENDRERIALAAALGDPAAEKLGLDLLPNDRGLRETFYQYGFTLRLFSKSAWYAYERDLLSQRDFAIMSIHVVEHIFPRLDEACEPAVQLLNLSRDILRQGLLLQYDERQIYERQVNSLEVDDLRNRHFDIIQAASIAALQAITRPDPPAWFLGCCDSARQAFQSLPWSNEPHSHPLTSTPELAWQRDLLVNFLLGRVGIEYI